MTTTTYYVTWPADTVYRSFAGDVGYYEGWIDGRWKPVLLSEQDHENLRGISEAEAKSGFGCRVDPGDQPRQSGMRTDPGK